MDALVTIFHDLLIFIGAMVVLLIILIVVISCLADDNPLKRIMTALSYRVAATLGAGVVAMPVEPVPGLDVLYNLGVPAVLIYYWYTFVRGAFRATRPAAPRDAERR